jgi:hypothetical protein
MQEDILNFIQLAANVNFYLIIAQCLPSELDITKETTITMGYFCKVVLIALLSKAQEMQQLDNV